MPIVGEAAFREGSLANVLASRVLSVGEALHVGLDLAADLEALHARRVVHRAVHPEAVIVNAQRGAARLVAPMDRPLDDATEAGIPLAYVSPEQTGRMDRTVDHRTDFYSLGATLYHALSGHPPFAANDSLELVHAHIAVTPVELSEIDPSIPRQVSRLVGKLLSKNANDRYQHARALRSDLEECLRQLESGDDIEEFPLGLGDDSRFLQTPDALGTYLEAAKDGFVRWGATLEVARLDAERPELAPRRLSRPSERPGALDLLGVVRASQALSSEIELPVLLERMMQVIVQTAGADRGSLLLERNGALCIEARVDAGSGVVDVLSELPLVGPTTVSEAIVRYAIRTGEDVVLADATHDDTFGRDPYVVSQGSKSILCMPVRHRDRTSGALFLENGLSTNAFTHERLEVLRILVAQAAISLENARLYDATQRLNKELAAGEARLREVFEGLPIGIYVVDLDGNPTFANPAAEQIVGKIMDPTAGISSLPETYSLFVAGTDEPYPVERLPIARALRGERVMADDIEIRLPDRTVPLATWGTPIRGEDGRVRYAVVAFQDISSQRAAESERAHLEEQLRQSERLEAIGRLAGGVAHDFNNLLTPMLVYSELAARSLPTDSAAYSQLGQIHDAAERAAEVTRQLLAFGRRQVLDSRLVDLNAEIREFEPILRRLVREDIAMDLRLDPEAGQTRADPVQIQRVLMNLVANAADAMPRGGRLGVETGRVDRVDDTGRGAPPESLGPCVVLRISDTGHGMNDATLAKIFDPFFTTKAPGKGTGLGLPTVYGLVKQHGGHITAHSELGVGSTFEVFLPRVSDVVSEADRHVTTTTSERISGHGESILVVEDEAAVRSVVNDVLSSDGYEVFATGSPTEALKLAEALGDRLDLVVTDVIMPEMNGRELVSALAAERPGLAAVFISGYSEDAISAHGVLEPGFELLQKPFSIEALRDRVREVLARRKRSEADGTAAG